MKYVSTGRRLNSRELPLTLTHYGEYEQGETFLTYQALDLLSAYVDDPKRYWGIGDLLKQGLSWEEAVAALA